MSGAYCEGCGEGNLLPDPGGAGRTPVRCDLCGWTADGAELGSKWMDDEVPWTKRERKEQGKLFFLWIDLDRDEPDCVESIMHLLKLDGMTSSAKTLLELERKPSEETLASLRGVRGVSRVSLVP